MSLHPSLAAVRRPVRQLLRELAPGSTVVVAVSGGPDSMALASAAIVEGHKLDLRIVGATVDHDLQLDSAEVAALTAERLAALGIDETVTIRVRVEDPEHLGPESAARDARYAALDQFAESIGAAAVLLGHTRDDQAETVLLGLARGSGGRSIAGMRREFDRYRRPLLDVSRDDTVTACQVEGIEVWHDPHNEDPGYARVRVRRAVLPVLEEQLGPGVAAALARTAEQVRDDVDLLDAVSDTEWRELEGVLQVDVLIELPRAVRTRLLRRGALEAGAIPAELTFEHVRALDELVTAWRGQRWIDLPGHLRGLRVDGVITFEASR